MEENSQHNKKTKQANSVLDNAIDTMDIVEIEKQLSRLEDLVVEIEDSKFFAKKIINTNQKGNHFMKKNYKKLGTVVASVALAVVLGSGTIYATGIYKTFEFFNEETTTIVKTKHTRIEDKEAARLAKEASEAYDEPHKTGGNVMEVQEKTFGSIQEVQEELNIDIVIPKYIPEGVQQEDTINVETTAHEAVGRTDRVYTTYRSINGEEKCFGITVIKEEMKEDVTSIVTTDAVYKDRYTNEYGDEYLLFNEDGGIIAQTTIKNIEYVLVFMGIDETEVYKTIDSTDLGIYHK